MKQNTVYLLKWNIFLTVHFPKNRFFVAKIRSHHLNSQKELQIIRIYTEI